MCKDQGRIQRMHNKKNYVINIDVFLLICELVAQKASGSRFVLDEHYLDLMKIVEYPSIFV